MPRETKKELAMSCAANRIELINAKLLKEGSPFSMPVDATDDTITRFENLAATFAKIHKHF